MAKKSVLMELTFEALSFRTAAIYKQGFTSLECTIKYF